jgi:myo-inositol-1(or 4)-monophosphatase
MNSTGFPAGVYPPGLRSLALEAAHAGASAIKRVISSGSLRTDTKSQVHDLVTTADRESEEAVLATLRAARPDDALLGEETGEQPGTSGIRWLVDPLDGTANFIYHRAGWSVSVGAESQGVAIAGAVVSPTDGRWTAADPGGIEFSSAAAPFTGPEGLPRPPRRAIDYPSDLRRTLVSVGQPYGLELRADVLRVVAALIGRWRAVRMTGAAAFELAGLVHGECDAYLGFGLSPWDTAAGEAIIRAAGGSIRRVDSPIGVTVLIASTATEVAAALFEQVANTRG